MDHWAHSAVFYHIYPLGLTGAPFSNGAGAPATERLAEIDRWIPHIKEIGANAVYLGPVFESMTHGYDIVNYYEVDRRLGTRETLARLIGSFHDAEIRVVLDAVFNHVGRDFWAFRDLLAHGRDSAYRDWFAGVRWDGPSPLGDPFSYETWGGHPSLVKLETRNPDVGEHLMGAARLWLGELGADGLRLDAADCLDHGFIRDVASCARSVRADAWLLGEAIHGDYRRLANRSMLDSVTNYVAYKGLWSSLRDRNYWEIAYTLERQFGAGGDYRDIALYAFADNHDVDRVASILGDATLLRPLYALLFTMPGVPSIYYGSEWGVAGVRGPDDRGVRPALDPIAAAAGAPDPDLAGYIARLARVRHASQALRRGSYRQLHVAMEQLAFVREADGERVVVALNASTEHARLELPIDADHGEDLIGEPDTIERTASGIAVVVTPRAARAIRLA